MLCHSPHCRAVRVMFDREAELQFCPKCFLIEDFDQLMQRPWTYELCQIMKAYRFPLRKFRGRAQDLYNRAADSRNTALGENDILSLVGTDISQLDSVRLSIVDHLLNTLITDSWYKVKYVDTRPPLAERTLIVQLHMLIVSAARYSFGDEIRHMVHYEAEVTQVPNEELAENDSCSICREPYGTLDKDGKAEVCVRTNCNHTFGDRCLGSWILENITCPICRGKLTCSLPQTEPSEKFATEPVVRDTRGLSSRDCKGRHKRIDKAGTPDWMIALLGAKDADSVRRRRG